METEVAALFRQEAAELLEDLEASLLKLEGDPDNNDGIARVFRVIHTLKGSAGMAGFQEVVRFTHDVETVFDRVRKGTLAVTRELLTLALHTKDHLQLLLASDPEGNDTLVRHSDALLAQFRPLIAQEESTPPLPQQTTDKGGAMATWWIRYHPAPGSMLTNPLGMLDELNDLGRMVLIFHLDDLPDLASCQPEVVLGWWDILLNMEQGQNQLDQVFIFKEPGDHLVVHQVARGAIRTTDLNELLEVLKPGDADETRVLAALNAINRVHCQKRAQRKSAAPPLTAAAELDNTTIRVDAGRLDTLVDMMGELVILQSRMTMASHQIGHAMLTQIAEDFERMTASMRNNALALRMMPIGNAFGALRRLVRDLSLTLGKEVNLVTEGEETKLDKTVLDRLKDPLMHLLRNSLDHGLELPEERLAAGKPAVGTVRLSASTASGEVFVHIHDDGRGIHPQRIRQKALERGLITPEQELGEKELLNLIFEPGFSTAERVSDVSGRGVGMDVVKKSIDALRGDVDVQSSMGQGSTFTIRLPLTLAIIDGMMVQIARETFIIPLNAIKACQERLASADTGEVDAIERMGHLIPCVNLRRMLKVTGPPPEYERVIIVQVDGMTVGLAVDVVIGRQQAVIKRLGRAYKNSTWISGTSINGDGSISLILDVLQLVRHAANHGTSP